ncbi:ABC transporter substrate-binding protein [Halobacteriales archaeon SW_7_71_33]|nr:MAG: ABC transporter substrate-binding protein [Halobacteriales archaeon SW_7_71_33]
MTSDERTVDRRSFLKAAGGAAVTAAAAGCTGDGGGGDDRSATDTYTVSSVGGPFLQTVEAEGTDTLVYARGDHPQNYDPQQTTSGEVAKVTNQVFDQLIQFDPGSGGQLADGLATEYSLEGSTASLTLRDGVTFHDGSELTAADVRASIRRFTDADYDFYLGDENRSGYGPFTFGNWVASVDDSQDGAVTIELQQQYAPFLRNLAMFAAAILSADQIQGRGASPDDQAALGTQPAGTGAFQLEEIDNSNQRVRLTANDDYWGDGPQTEELVFKTIGENATRAQDVIDGASHITDNLDSQSSQQLQNSDSAELLRKNGINVGYMAMNMARYEPFRDRRVRRAVSFAVDTEAIVDSIYEGFATQASQPLPPDVLGHNEELEPYETDKEEAQSLLEDADQTGLEFELATFSNPRGYNPSPIQTAQQVKSDLEELDAVDAVNINQFSTFTSYLEYTAQGRHDACFLGWYTDNADPDNFLYVLLDPKVDLDAVPDGQDWVSFDTEGYSTLNVSGWANTDYMETVREAQATLDQDEREEMYTEANRLAHDEAPWVFVDYAETLRGVNEAVQ